MMGPAPMRSVGRFRVAAEHPSLPGHFPGHPVVPGVVLLDEVLARLPEGARLLTAKFTAPVAPGVDVEIHSAAEPAGQTRFACFVEGQPVLHGTVGQP